MAQSANPQPQRKTITISIDTFNRIKARKGENDTYDDVICRFIAEPRVRDKYDEMLEELKANREDYKRIAGYVREEREETDKITEKKEKEKPVEE
ncbi:antitoxin VapB family protein [Methanoplanus endosymbiosus]|uniref:Antitoxin VapB family protein n=1 Tax=Methanoplanus endosymbiosus TaxID=33865 RepID=A0A9E7TL44_9EURY|nr:antitoxin VapB family protein [Methanoplanus endosymbiosus]UUX91921.1 antitoxin VapB family protein [Methanoplanus endosymbiosus]